MAAMRGTGVKCDLVTSFYSWLGLGIRPFKVKSGRRIGREIDRSVWRGKADGMDGMGGGGG